ncbi:hypothetical protein [Niallia taxi]|uniref:hypothetical protein n=1 Tax=Niallia taxi TaxID=2499688 RepID=UPI0013E3B625|nr:hypothetical protein [Niallia taxi]
MKKDDNFVQCPTCKEFYLADRFDAKKPEQVGMWLRFVSHCVDCDEVIVDWIRKFEN